MPTRRFKATKSASVCGCGPYRLGDSSSAGVSERPSSAFLDIFHRKCVPPCLVHTDCLVLTRCFHKHALLPPATQNMRAGLTTTAVSHRIKHAHSKNRTRPQVPIFAPCNSRSSDMCALYYTGCSTPVPKIASIDQSAHEIEAQQSAKRNGIFRAKQGGIAENQVGDPIMRKSIGWDKCIAISLRK